MISKKRLVAITMATMMAFGQSVSLTEAWAYSSANKAESYSPNEEVKNLGLRVQYYTDSEFEDFYKSKVQMDGKIDLSDVINDKKIKSVYWKGCISPKYTDTYTFSTNQDRDIKIYVDGNKIFDGKKVSNGEQEGSKKVELQVGKLYKFEIKYVVPEEEKEEIKLVTDKEETVTESVYSKEDEKEEVSLNSEDNDKLSPELEIYHEGEYIRKSIVREGELLGPIKRFYKDENGEDEDTDEDGITDKLETEGYTVIDGEIEEWEDSYEGKYTKYVTSPLTANTDGDPYTDYQEVTGIGMDDSVIWPGNHPLVAAYPDIRVTLDSIKMTSTDEHTTSNTEGKTKGISHNTVQETSTEITNGCDVGVGYSAEITAGTKGTEVKHTVSVELGYNYSKTKSDTVSIDKGTSEEESKEFTEEVSKNPAEAANLAFNLHYENKGTATAYEVKPNVSFVIGEASAKTLNLPESVQSAPIRPGGKYPRSSSGLNVDSYGGDDTKITLTLDQVNMIEHGTPFSLSTNRTYAQYRTSDYELKDWSLYTTDIESRTATINVSLPGEKGLIERKVAAKNPSKQTGKLTPELTLGEAIKLVYDTEVDSKGNLIIEGEKFDRSWIINFGEGTEREVRKQLGSGDNIFNLKLRPGMNIMLEKPSADSQKNGPNIRLAKVDFNKEGAYIQANVAPRYFEVERVIAQIKQNDGKKIEVELENTENGLYKTNSSFASKVKNLDLHTVKVVAYDIKGNSTTQNAIVSSQYVKPGLTFVRDKKSLNNGNLKGLIEELKQNGAESFVLSKDVTDDKHNTSKYVGFGNNKYYTGLIEQDKKGKPILGDLMINSSGNWYKPNTAISLKHHKWDDHAFVGIYDYENYSAANGYLGYRRKVAQHRTMLKNESFAWDKWHDEWDNSISSVWEYYDSLKSKGRGLVLFDGVNFDGDVFGLDKSIPNLGDESNFRTSSSDITPIMSTFNNKTGSYKLVDTFKPLADPKHHYTFAVSAKDLENYSGDTNGLTLEGYYVRSNEGSKFTPSYKENNSTVINKKSGTGYINGNLDATGYLVKITTHNVSSDNINFTFNPSTNDETSVSMGTSDSSGFGYKMGAYYAPTHSEIVYIPANAYNPGQIEVKVNASEHTQWYGKDSETVEWFKEDQNKSKYTVAVIGYYSEEGKYYYEDINPIPLKNASTAIEKQYANINKKYYGDRFTETPKGYMVKVTTKDAGSSKLRININGQSADLGTSASKDHNGLEPVGIDHTELMYVPVKAEDNPYAFDITTEHNSKFVNHGSYQMEIVGYYY
ncbi:binary toxin-like calcium binding domain-containing protein [Tepidibacter sp. Z1-5]|uniref:binary toxin-like calcium binding domain-containing protein n=1 Tax=Tepidibacter sp. Z1-5 TaxID=3134138 RepID=UPI0030BCA7FE